MAKQTQDKEDLIRDGSQFIRRLELDLQPSKRPAKQDIELPRSVFCGFRENGACSIYWGQEFVIQFNTNCELRRAFWESRMVATYKRIPHWLKSEGSGRVRLQRVSFSDDEVSRFERATTQTLDRLADVLDSIASTELESAIRQVPQDADVAGEVRSWLDNWHGIRYALHPGVGKSQSPTSQ